MGRRPGAFGEAARATGSGRGDERHADPASRGAGRLDDDVRFDDRGRRNFDADRDDRDRVPGARYGEQGPRAFDQCPTCGQWTIDAAAHEGRGSSRDDDEPRPGSARTRRPGERYFDVHEDRWRTTRGR